MNENEALGLAAGVGVHKNPIKFHVLRYPRSVRRIFSRGEFVNATKKAISLDLHRMTGRFFAYTFIKKAGTLIAITKNGH